MRSPNPVSDHASTTPWLTREGAFRFELGLRPGSEDFFKLSADAPAILAKRREILATHGFRHAAMLDAGVPLLREAQRFAQDVAGIEGRETDDALADCIALSQYWEPDFLLLRFQEAGAPVLAGGCVCFPSSWDLHEKLGRPVEAIHAPVPTLNTMLGSQIDSFLRKLKPAAVWQRWNWGMTASEEWNHHPALPHPRLAADATLASSWLRLEHQAFRLLESGAGFLFGIRVSVTRLSDVAQNRLAARRLAELLTTMPDDVARYKGLAASRLGLAAKLEAAAACRGAL